MRLHFQEQPWDLRFAIGYAVVMAGVLLALGVGNPLAILLVLFVPGYVLVAALFPTRKELDWIERIALSLGLSIAVVPLLGLLLNFTPFGIRFAPILVTIAAFTVLVGFGAYWRRLRTPIPDRLSATLEIRIPDWKAYTPVDKALTVGLAVATVIASAALGYTLLTPRPGSPFTEFYLLGPGGNASGYPTQLNVSEPGTVIVRVANHEFARVNYTVRIDLVGVDSANRTIELNRTTWSWFNATLETGQTWTQPYGFSINATGLWKVEFLLYRDGNLGQEYLTPLRLFVTVV